MGALFLTSESRAQLLSPAEVSFLAYNAGTVTIPIQPGAAWRGAYAYGMPIAVRPGTRIVWVNYDSIPHTVSSFNGAWDSGVLYPGWGYQVFAWTYGRYPYFCRFYPSMTGFFDVVW